MKKAAEAKEPTRRRKVNGQKLPTCTGRVISTSIAGWGLASAQLYFIVRPGSGQPDIGFTVTAPPRYEPQVFSSMATLVTAAIFTGHIVEITYSVESKGNFPHSIYVK